MYLVKPYHIFKGNVHHKQDVSVIWPNNFPAKWFLNIISKIFSLKIPDRDFDISLGVGQQSAESWTRVWIVGNTESGPLVHWEWDNGMQRELYKS